MFFLVFFLYEPTETVDARFPLINNLTLLPRLASNLSSIEIVQFWNSGKSCESC